MNFYIIVDDSTLSKSMTLALGATTPHRSRNSQSQSGQTRSRKNHGSNSGKYKESESDTSGSPNREPYRVPVKPPRGLYKQYNIYNYYYFIFTHYYPMAGIIGISLYDF